MQLRQIALRTHLTLRVDPSMQCGANISISCQSKNLILELVPMVGSY